MWTRTQQGLIIANALLLLLFIVLLAGCYRLVPEDYYAVLGNVKYGVSGQAFNVCETWGGRFFSYLFSFFLLDLYERGISFSWYFLAGCLLLWISFSCISAYIFKRYSLAAGSMEIFTAGGFCFVLLFYLTPGKEESWFWAAASTSYFWGLVMAVCGLALMVSHGQKWYKTLTACICFLYVCSASEPFALMVIFFFFILLILQVKAKKPDGKFWPYLLIFVFCLIGFLLMINAGGTVNRWNAMPELNPGLKLKRTFGAVAKYYLYEGPALLFHIIIFLPLALPVGLWLREIVIKEKVITPVKFLFMVTGLYTLILFFSFLPACYVMGEAGPLRSWHHIGFYNVCLFLIIAGYFGYHFVKTGKKTTIVLTLYFIFCTFLHGAYLYKELEKANQYALAVDKRIVFLKALRDRNFTGEIILDRLPESGLLFSAEIGQDKNYYTNTFLKNGLKLNFNISVK